MLKLPNIPYSMEKNKNQVISMGNVNYSKMTNNGDIADSSGISDRYYPYITTAKVSEAVRVGVVANGKIVAMTVFRGKFVEIDENGNVYYDGAPVGSVATEGMGYSDVQFAAINTKLVIMPFKKYLDCGDEENGVSVKSLGAKITTTTATTFTSDSVTLAGEAAQSYRMIGGTISGGNRFTATQCKTLASFAAPDYIAVDNYGSLKILTPVKDLGAVGVYQIVHIDDTGKVITMRSSEKLRKYLFDFVGGYVYIYSEKKKVGALCEIYNTSRGSELFPDWFEYDLELSESCGFNSGTTATGEIDTSFQLFVSRDFSFTVSPGNILNCRMNLTNKYTQKNYSKFLSARINEKKHIYVSSSDLENIWRGVYTGTIDNGGWNGDFRDFLSVGRGVSLIYVDSGGAGSEVEVVGTVSEVNQIDFTVDHFTKDGAAFAAGEAISSLVTVTADINEKASLKDYFVPGDVVTISGCGIDGNNIDFQIESISEDGKTLYTEAEIFEETVEGGGTSLTIERRIPKLDYICECDNRLYGCSNEDNTIYVSALGDPTNIYAYQGISTDSYAVAVASEEPFTGCCPYDGGVLFWKENKLHKLLGSYPAEYALYTYNIDGVKEGSHKSLQNIGEVLFYKGVRGVYAFDGSPRMISSNFGDRYFTDAVAGSDGEHYLISMKDDGGKDHFFSYNTRSGLWVREGDCCVTAFARQGKDVYMLEDDEICRYGAVESTKDSEWFVQFTPIYETIEGQKTYSRIRLRIELPLESDMVISVRCDGGRWAECGKIVGRVDGVVPVVVPINRCDKFELKIEGKGPFVIHSILREYYVGGDR